MAIIKPTTKSLHFVHLAPMWKKFKHKVVRDLAWSICSSSLLKESLLVDAPLDLTEINALEVHLASLDENPKPLQDYLNANNTHRLGHYFEHLVFYWLKISSRYELIENNIPVRTEKGISKGEVDLIVFDKTQGHHQHWELAVKFFLAHENTKQASIYIGPNANDFLHLKLQKLENHQCKILETTEGKGVLKRLNVSSIETKLFVKGVLFYRPQQVFKIPDNIHGKHLKSWWVYLREVNDFFKEGHQFRLLHKKQWLSTPDFSNDTMSKEACCKQMQAKLLDSPRSLYVAVYKYGKLLSTGFVVHNNWPNLE